MSIPTKLNSRALDNISLYSLNIPTVNIADVSYDEKFMFVTDMKNYGIIGIDIDDTDLSFSLQFVESEINDVFNIIRTIFNDNIVIENSSDEYGYPSVDFESMLNYTKGQLLTIHTYISPLVFNEGDGAMTRYKCIQVIVLTENGETGIFYVWRDSIDIV